MAFKILSLTENALLNQELARQLDDLPFDLVFVSKNHDALALVKKTMPKIIVNFLPASGEVDEAMVTRVSELIAFANERHIPIIQMSSHIVLAPIESEEKLNEASQWAQPLDKETHISHLQALEALYQSCEKHIVLRTSWVLDSDTQSCFEKILDVIFTPHPNGVVSDHRFGTPVNSTFLVRVVVALMQQVLCDAQNWGVYHVCSTDACSEAELADQLVRVINGECSVSVDLPFVAGKDDDRFALAAAANLSGQMLTDSFGVQLPTWRKNFKSEFLDWLKTSSKYRHLLKE